MDVGRSCNQPAHDPTPAAVPACHVLPTRSLMVGAEEAARVVVKAPMGPLERVDTHDGSGANGSASGRPRLTAYLTPGLPEIEIVPASRWRDWMDGTSDRWANRCLPLLMANESGWSLLNPHGFAATWQGGKRDDSVRIDFDEPVPRDTVVASIFGYGIVTWSVPYLFRTDPGWNLLARGPMNEPRDGAGPLEGLVETDWASATFTMNWKLTRPGLSVRFEAGEPFCTIVPQRRYELEAFEPRKALLAEDGELEDEFKQWERSREKMAMLKFVSQFGTIEGFDPLAWEQDYFRGETQTGRKAPEHQTKRRLQPFADPSSSEQNGEASRRGHVTDSPER
jgi:Family of unknown function (DUF6065)